TEELAADENSEQDFSKSQKLVLCGNNEVVQSTSDQAQQTTPDIHQRYLVETITMTTVTERRIVREISEEESSVMNEVNRVEKRERSLDEPKKEVRSIEEKEGNSVRFDEASSASSDTPDVTEVSLTFKLGNVSLVTNSLKPNSAVRQLFPDPRFISPPPAPTKGTIATMDTSGDGMDSDAQKFLVTTESLRLFDAVKRSKIASSRSDSSESESSGMKKTTIERNALRRSLVCKYDSSSRRNSLRTKDLTLEERIRQLTCVDQDEQEVEDGTSENTMAVDANEAGETSESCHAEMTNIAEIEQFPEMADCMDFPVRTSPSGEERPKVADLTVRTSNSQERESASCSVQGNVHHQSTYRKLTDLFAQKKTVEGNLPDLAIGNKMMQSKEYSLKTSVIKMNSDARKQFLASLAPLSCVGSTGENREDYYQLSTKANNGGNRDSTSCNSDSSYSVEDIEEGLRGEERNRKNGSGPGPGPPDVTRGTPIGTGPDCADTTDELLAFVEQDKSRTERIKRRYNDVEDRHENVSSESDVHRGDGDDGDDDDELNDYGFNRRPSVRGIKTQFDTTQEIVHQLRSRGAAPNSFPSPLTWPCPEKNGEILFSECNEEDSKTCGPLGVSGDANTINRINTMQKQIDDIYQTIAETAASVQGTLDRGTCVDTDSPRPLIRVPLMDGCQRFGDVKNVLRFQDGQQLTPPRTLRVAGNGDGSLGPMYNSLPAKARRAPSVPAAPGVPQAAQAMAISNYHYGVVPPSADTKCYRTMYFVPYNGISDPTYQNIQRILPHMAPHTSPSNYANHIERYPYSRGTRPLDQQTRFRRPPAPLPQLHSQLHTQLHSQLHSQPLHLHLHQTEEFRVPGAPISIPRGIHPLHHAQHQHHQVTPYSAQAIPVYSVVTPTRVSAPVGGYSYQSHPGPGGRGATDVQTQTMSFPACASLAVYDAASASPSSSSPTKHQQQQRTSACTVAERGVPEGAVSAPSHDFLRNGPITTSHSAVDSFLDQPGNLPPPNTQNSVYYAMNV
ncbi:uncharacterized protein LOC105700137, partial [Orussus abietinus]|uniref:uncharacterized protein LOC105700137 n=1 Tax=Orussus abietinus TaxID=222816 RepID=UPI000C715FBA